MGLILSKEYGVNPSVEVCVICGEEMGVVMLGNSYKENGKPAKAPHKICMGNLCPNCQKAMDAGGIFFIEIQDGESGKEHPQRTGRFCCIKESAVKKVFSGYARINHMEQSMFANCFSHILP